MGRETRGQAWQSTIRGTSAHCGATRLMFRTSIGTGLLGCVDRRRPAGVACGPLPIFLPWGLLLVSGSGALALKVAQSTARLLEADGLFSRQS